MPGYGGVKIEGLASILLKLNFGGAYAGEWNKAIEDVARIGEKLAQRRAPVGVSRKASKRSGGHGSLRMAVTRSVDSNPIKLWARVTLGKVERNGFRYGYALNASKRYHRSQAPNRCKTTAGWFHGALGGMRRAAKRLLGQAGKEIEANWGK